MTVQRLRNKLYNTSLYDMSVHSPLPSTNGMKISIQGKCLDHSIFLYERLVDFLTSQNIPFKLATINRYAMRNTNPEQSFKAMTIYCPDGMDFQKLCEDIYSLIPDYKGWYDIKTPTAYQHYAGALFTRNDRDENGSYIPAKNSS